MTLIITVYTNEGIVMASDSRVTFNRTSVSEDESHLTRETINYFSIHIADTTYKTFVSETGVGISVAGEATLNNSPITGHIEEFIRVNPNASVTEIPQLLLDYFKTHNPAMNTRFHVAGYAKLGNHQRIPKLYVVDVCQNSVDEKDISNPGALWTGEIDVVDRLINQSFNQNGDQKPQYDILWEYFTLQDAVDFVKYAIQTTIDTMRFQQRPKTVGGSIDILLLRPNGSQWLVKKEIHP